MSEEAESQFLTEEEAVWRRRFQQCDIDSRGSLNQEQFLSMLTSSSVANGDAIYMALERDEEGRVSMEGFLAGFQGAVMAASPRSLPSPGRSSNDSRSPSHYNMRRPASSSSESDADTIASLGESIESLQGEKSALVGQLKVHEAQMTAAHDDIDQLEHESRKLRSKIEDSELRNAKLGEELRQKHSELQAISNEFVSLKAQYEDVSAQLGQSQSAVQKSEHELQTLQDRMRSLDAAQMKELEVYQAKIAEMERLQDEKLEKMKESMEELQRKLVDAQKDAHAKVEEWKEKYHSEQKKYHDLRLDQTFLEEEIKALKREKMELENAVSRPSTSSSNSLSHTPLSTGKANSMKILKPSTKGTPSTPMTRSSSGSVGASAAPIPLTPLGTTIPPTSSSLSRSSSGVSVPSGGDTNNTNGNGGGLSPRASPPPLIPHDGNSIPISTSAHTLPGMSQSMSGSSLAAKRKSLGVEDVDTAKSFSRALSHYNGDLRDKLAEFHRQDSDHDPLAGLTIQVVSPQAQPPVTVTNTSPRSDSPFKPKEPAPNSTDMKLNSMKTKVLRLEADLKRTKNDSMAEIADLKAQVDQLTRELHMKKEETDQLRRSSQVSLDTAARTEALASQLSAARAQIQELETTKADAETQLRQAEEEYDSLSQEHDKMEADHSKCATRISQLQSDFDAQNMAIQNVAEIAKNREQALLQERILAEEKAQSSEQEVAKLSKRLTFAEQQLQHQNEIKGRISELENEKEMWDRSNNDWSTKLEREMARSAALEQELAELKARLQEASSITQSKNLDTDSVITDLNAKIADTAIALEKAQSELNQVRSSMEEWKSEANSKESIIQELKKQLDEKQIESLAQIDALKNDIATLTELHQRTIVEKQSSELIMSSLKDEITKQNEELDGLRQLSGAAAVLQVELDTSHSLADSLRQEITSGHSKIEQLQKDLISGEDEHEHLAESLRSTIASSHSLIEKLRSDLDLAQTRSEKIQGEYEKRIKSLEDSHAARISDLRAEYDKNFSDEVSKHSEVRDNLESLASELQEEVQSRRRRESDLEKEIDGLRASLESLKAAHSESDSHASQLRLELESQLAAQREDSAKLLQDLETAKTEASEASSLLQMQISAKEARIETCEQELKESESKNHDLEKELETLRRQLHSRNEASVKMKDEAARAKEQILEMFRGRDEIDGTIEENELEELRHQHEEELSALRAQWRQAEEVATKHADALQEQVNLVTEELRTLRSDAAQKDYAVQVAFVKTEVERLKQDSLVAKQHYEAEMEKLRAEAALHLASCGEKDAQLKTASQASSSQEQRIGELEKSVESSKKEKDEAVASLQSRISDLQKEGNEKLKQITSSSHTEKKKLEDTMSSMAIEKHKIQEEAKKKEKDMMDSIAELTTQLTELHKQHEAAKQNIESLREALTHVKEQTAGKLEQIDPSWMTNKEAEVANLSKKIVELNKKLLETQQKQTHAQKDTSTSTTRSTASTTEGFDLTSVALTITPILILAYLIFVHMAVYDPHVSFLS